MAGAPSEDEDTGSATLRKVMKQFWGEFVHRRSP